MPAPEAAVAVTDPWRHLRRFTAARIALGRTGGSQPTSTILAFRLAHARARDAVVANFSPDLVSDALRQAGVASEILTTATGDRRTYLQRPDLGRLLSRHSREKVTALATQYGNLDLAIIVSDGLGAAAAERHSVPTLLPLISGLRDVGWKICPVLIVPFARVKLQDEVGTLLGARYTLMLLGERPGLSAPDSLGAYFTASPAPERTDADRNCVSNIRPDGLAPAQAAEKLIWLLRESARTGLRGTALKDTQIVPALTAPGDIAQGPTA